MIAARFMLDVLIAGSGTGARGSLPQMSSRADIFLY